MSVPRPHSAPLPVHLFVALALSFPLAAGPAYEQSKHGDPVDGVMRLPELAPGACGQCHASHGTEGGMPSSGPYDKTLFDVNDETLCYSCHAAEGSNLVYPGSLLYAESAHFMSPEFYWPGPSPPANGVEDAGKCINCHDPHATEDGTGIVPSMLHLREESLCLGCHDGAAAADVKAQFARTFHHPIALSERHQAEEAKDPLLSTQRHAECADCHNAHTARTDSFGTTAPEASYRLRQVARVVVVNGAAGTRPVYDWRSAADTSVPNEFEICFKCHSAWKSIPPGKPDLSVLTNPNNASYHPVQARGRNQGVALEAFVDGWSWDRLVLCSDCHGSDDTQVAGPHGSSYQHILKARYQTGSSTRPMASTDLCFRCHSYQVYADPLADAATQDASRFNDPAGRGHAYHVGSQQVPCYGCHATHGSVDQPALIATGRMSGIMTYTQSAGGGSCSPSCHVARSYTVNYPR